VKADIADIVNSDVKSISLDYSKKELIVTKNDDSTVKADISDIVNSDVKSIALDYSNKELIVTKNDDSTVKADISDIVNSDVKSIALDYSNKELIVTKNDDSTVKADIADIVNSDVKSLSLDYANSKITVTKNDDTNIDLDISDIKNDIESRISSPSDTTTSSIVIFTDDKGAINDSIATVDNDNKLLGVGDITYLGTDKIAINKNGSGDRESSIELFSKDGETTTPQFRITKKAGENGDLEIINSGTGNIITGFDNGYILSLDGACQIVGSTDTKYAGNANNKHASIDDLNNLIDTGTYNFSSGDVKNSPVDSWCYISVVRHSNNNSKGKWVQQTITDMNGTVGAKYYREIKDDDNGWSAWTPLQYGLELKEVFLKDIVEFRNDWKHYDDDWGARIVRKPDGTVIINGILEGGDNDTEVCTLPEEYRPEHWHLTTQMCASGEYQRVDFYDNGVIKVRNEGTRDNTDWITFNITYSAKYPL
jgi:hypothetical protein